MRTQRSLTLAELLFTVAALAVLLCIVVYLLIGLREKQRRAACAGNLRRVAAGMETYIRHIRFFPCPLGRTTTPDDYNGAEWLAALYWTGVVIDPSIFLCPTSGDSNRGGLDIGTHRAPAAFGSQTVSYAGMHYHSGTDAAGHTRAGAIRDDFPPHMAMGSDDTQGSVNHGTGRRGGMAVLFFDSHVEWVSRDRLDPEAAVGDQGPGGGAPKGLLWQLRN